MTKVGNTYRVYIEDSDGNLVEVTGIMRSMELSNDYYSLPVLTLSLSATQEILTTQYQDVIERKHTTEWQCTYCQRVNQRADEVCKSCGAVRSIIYG